MAMNNAASAQVALDFGITGPDLTFCTACSSSSVAIGEAVRQIRHGYTDVMLAGGSEALLTFGTIKAWEALRTLADEDEANLASSHALNQARNFYGVNLLRFCLKSHQRHQRHLRQLQRQR